MAKKQDLNNSLLRELRRAVERIEALQSWVDRIPYRPNLEGEIGQEVPLRCVGTQLHEAKTLIAQAEREIPDTGTEPYWPRNPDGTPRWRRLGDMPRDEQRRVIADACRRLELEFEKKERTRT